MRPTTRPRDPPPGTGKSSLVCALCLGLGGSTKLLGRADSIKDYVQRGCEEAWTELTLSGGAGRGDMVVRRDIKQVRKDDGSQGYVTKWRLNGGRGILGGDGGSV
jgi:chromosome segregation ATPase